MCLQQIDCVHNNAVMELMRGVRSQLSELISGLASQDLAPMSLGLSHSLSRYKLKFSPDKVICYVDLFISCSTWFHSGYSYVTNTEIMNCH